MFHPSITREPGNEAASSNPRMPEAGKLGNFSPAGTGITSVLPALVRDGRCRETYRNLPSGDQMPGQPCPQTGRGGPPSTGTAIVIPTHECGDGIIDAIHP